MTSNNERLEPRLVAVDSYYLSVIDERIQDLSNDAERAFNVEGVRNEQS